MRHYERHFRAKYQGKEQSEDIRASLGSAGFAYFWECTIYIMKIQWELKKKKNPLNSSGNNDGAQNQAGVLIVGA